MVSSGWYITISPVFDSMLFIPLFLSSTINDAALLREQLRGIHVAKVRVISETTNILMDFVGSI
jgi:hypothetical protein